MGIKLIKVDNTNYELIKEYKEGFNEEEFLKKCTEYFYEFDYIFGDYSYDVLRLKGFYDKNNKSLKNINNINILDNYIKEYCSHECKWFLLKKVKKWKKLVELFVICGTIML